MFVSSVRLHICSSWPPADVLSDTCRFTWSGMIQHYGYILLCCPAVGSRMMLKISWSLATLCFDCNMPLFCSVLWKGSKKKKKECSRMSLFFVNPIFSMFVRLDYSATSPCSSLCWGPELTPACTGQNVDNIVEKPPVCHTLGQMDGQFKVSNSADVHV